MKTKTKKKSASHPHFTQGTKKEKETSGFSLLKLRKKINE